MLTDLILRSIFRMPYMYMIYIRVIGCIGFHWKSGKFRFSILRVPFCVWNSENLRSISGFFGKKDLTEIFFGFESFTVPTIIYRIDFSSTDKTIAAEVKVCSMFQVSYCLFFKEIPRRYIL